MTTDPVCEFYTQHPYPPPVANLDRARDEWRDPNRHRAEYHLLWPHQPYRADLEILVAGCGTWQAAKYAVCRPEARVLGIDVSATSLEHTNRLKQQYNLTNLETRQLAVEDLAASGGRFDLIVCTGVLHHLADADAGLAALRSVLKPDGVMYLMVYAPYGRTGIAMIQDYCRTLGIGTSADELRDLSTTLAALPPHHPLAIVLRGSRDASNPDALADALLNPRDRSYSVDQLFDFIDRAGLAFGRWYWQAPYFPHCGAIAATPHAARLSALGERARYAALELWRGAMTTHSVLAYDRRDVGGENRHEIGFDDDRWPRYIPIRRPHTVFVDKPVRVGGAGVLLNRSHAFQDLILAVDGVEKPMFDAIDGRRSIDAIVGLTSPPAIEQARLFFERLWRYDQIVVDAN